MIWIYVGAVLLVALILFFIYGYREHYRYVVEDFEIEVPSDAPFHKPIRLALIADFHSTQTFGPKGNKIVKAIEKLHPDAIVIAGDLTIKGEKKPEISLNFCRELKKIAPVFYSPGNHELRMEDYEAYVARLRRIGLHVLVNETENVEINGNSVYFTGLVLPISFFHRFWNEKKLHVEEIWNLVDEVPLKEEDSSGKPLRILIAHNPEYFKQYVKWGADVIFSGHIHGGVMQLPVLGGVISPSFRLFPKYDAGIFRENESTMLITRGLGSHHLKFRFFNPPQICHVTIYKDREEES